MPTKKLKLKNDKKWDLANLENSFLILTFFALTQLETNPIFPSPPFFIF